MSVYTDRIKPDDLGIATYLDNLLANKYQIPTFQRDVVWEKQNVKKLWDSIYKFYPLGSILVWKTDIKLQSHRQIGGIVLPETFDSTEYQYILDGQQRTTSLLTSLRGGQIAGRPGFDPTIYVDLSVPCADATDDESYKQRFLFWDEIDDRGGKLLANSGRQKRFERGLIVKLEDIRLNFPSLDRNLHEQGYAEYEDPHRKELWRIKEVLDNYRLSFIELKGIEVAEVCQIFERINQAGKPLNIFDIVVAKTFRPEDSADGKPGFYLRQLIDGFRDECGGSEFARLDDLTILQMLAVLIRVEFPGSDLKNITDRYLNEIQTEQVERIWDDARHAMKKVFDFFDNVLNVKGPNLVPFRYFYLTLVSYFYRNRQPDYTTLQKYFWHYSFHREDLLSNTTQLWNHIKAFGELKRESSYPFERFVIDRDTLRQSSYSSRGRLARAILSLFASRSPRDWAIPHKPVLADVYYILTDKPNLHHVFPMSFVEKNPEIEGINKNSLMNIAYLTQITNLAISDRNPLDYLKDYDSAGFEEVLDGHYIPRRILDWARMDRMPDDALDRFVEERIDRIADTLRSRLNTSDFTVVDTGAGEEEPDDEPMAVAE